jgi:hypothetical protein
MNRKERRAEMKAALEAAKAVLEPAWTEDTIGRMVAIQDALQIINDSQLKITYNGLPLLYEDMVGIAAADPDFPPESLEVLQRTWGKVQEAVQMVKQQNARFDRLAEDIVDTYTVWDKLTKK